MEISPLFYNFIVKSIKSVKIKTKNFKINKLKSTQSDAAFTINTMKNLFYIQKNVKSYG
ncbi:hypothetical protein YPC_3196 [Yersinia pestis biovar Medievalis str. Harbin 35]|uniref:Uncharacterized protein n=2 Tax=Yersinia pestis TaxID=632 RepID=Q8CLJ0_YERPE|nr:hypothetical [Yersinia pestis KIM10+]ABG17478.1 conserved hypothetical protein [Yersinia pestis Nepal516]ADV99700.1 hypothetical protein YPC_3196 [Yersinia pestis biovar Medievalis str. Harbin 35]EDR67396.1 conserved hypothetical protein [Yersinia pestis biovar Mediaevalis str. K1973002]ERP71521.1 hypothetical protein L327_13280 [Yersinia pestis S3]QOW15028.1 hypothetical protein S96127_2725 [Yersinia pestis]